MSYKKKTNLLSVLLLYFIIVLPATAAEVKELKSSNALLIEDHLLPIMSVSVSFDFSGAAFDPEGKSGLAYFVSQMIDEGAGEYNRKRFNELLEEKAITFYSVVDKDLLYIKIKTLTQHRDIAFKLLGLALSQAHFGKDELERERKRILVELLKEEERPNVVAEKMLVKKFFKKHPYSNPIKGYKESIEDLTRIDLQHYAQTHFTQANMKISAVGDIDEEELTHLINTHIILPEGKQSTLPQSIFPTPKRGQIKTVKKPNPQTIIAFAQSGIAFGHPDFYAAHILNYILGGGGFESRLMKEIREKNGLVYSIYTHLIPYQQAGVLEGFAATRNEEAKHVISLLKEQITSLKDKGISEEELQAAKNYSIGSFPLRMDSTEKLVNLLHFAHTRGMGTTFLDERNKMVEAVTLEQINRVAQEMLTPEKLTIVVVGQ